MVGYNPSQPRRPSQVIHVCGMGALQLVLSQQRLRPLAALHAAQQDGRVLLAARIRVAPQIEHRVLHPRYVPLRVRAADRDRLAQLACRSPPPLPAVDRQMLDARNGESRTPGLLRPLPACSTPLRHAIAPCTTMSVECSAAGSNFQRPTLSPSHARASRPARALTRARTR